MGVQYSFSETSQKFMNMLPFDVVKPIIEAASAEQLDSIVLHNPVSIVLNYVP